VHVPEYGGRSIDIGVAFSLGVHNVRSDEIVVSVMPD
jgi:hypothetical protein